jgi:hypothetical protein
MIAKYEDVIYINLLIQIGVVILKALKQGPTPLAQLQAEINFIHCQSEDLSLNTPPPPPPHCNFINCSANDLVLYHPNHHLCPLLHPVVQIHQ